MLSISNKLNLVMSINTQLNTHIIYPSHNSIILIPSIEIENIKDFKVAEMRNFIEANKVIINEIIKSLGSVGIFRLIRKIYKIKLSRTDISTIIEEIINKSSFFLY